MAASKITLLSTTIQFKKCNHVSVNKVEINIPDFGNDELKSIMIKNTEVFGDVDFNSTAQHQTLHRIELTGKKPFVPLETQNRQAVIRFRDSNRDMSSIMQPIRLPIAYGT